MARRRKKNNDLDTSIVIGILLIGIVVASQQKQSNLLWMCILLLAIILVGASLTLLLRYRANERLRRSNIEEIDKMPGLEFEKYIRLLLIDRGYTKVQLTSTYDLGVDIIAHKDNDIWAIQVKRYNKPVGLDAVRQAVAAMNHYKCTRSMVITNNYFTANARTIAQSVNCTLVNRDDLIKLILARS